MRRLGGIDSAFLGMETSAVHAHVVAVSVYDPSSSPHVFDAEHSKRLLMSKLDKIPAFRRRLAVVPGRFSMPYWIDDPDFDIENHVFEERIAAPGGRAELAAALNAIVEVQLDRSRPLWTHHVLTGLEGGLVAHATKMHHAAVDGETGVMIMHTLNTHDPQDVEIGPPALWPTDPDPSSLSMLSRGASDTVKSLGRIVGGSKNVVGAVPKLAKGLAGGRSGGIRKAPRLSFNKAITGRRQVAWTSLDFATVRALGKATGTTINDVVLTVTSIAMREWLIGRDELPDKPVIAGVPVSTRVPGEDADKSNQVSALMAVLPVHVADPLAQLQIIREDMVAQKSALQDSPANMIAGAADYLPPLMMRIGADTLESLHSGNWIPMPFNLGVSNVPGPRSFLYCTGAPLLRHFGFGFFPSGAGMNITLDSYVDHFDVSLMTCPDLVDNLWDLADELPIALEVLQEAIIAAEGDVVAEALSAAAAAIEGAAVIEAAHAVEPAQPVAPARGRRPSALKAAQDREVAANGSPTANGVAKRAPAKKTAAKRATPAKKAPAKKTAPKTEAPKKAPAKKATAKKATAASTSTASQAVATSPTASDTP
ncbi:MAG: wax ester/triacylglycerol synthase family O-acyltransferase [Phycicoccus sp.]|nr:wax ester/triacylglycerol synthase family O-acyltransferase [Phycicoccus sp.]